MLLYIHDNLRIADLQERFNNSYPWLNIEFYRAAHHSFDSSEESLRLDGFHVLGDIRKNHEQGYMDIMSTNTVKEVETRLREKFGLFAQVFRQSPQGWVQTTHTDRNTLASLEKMSGIPSTSGRSDKHSNEGKNPTQKH